MHNIVSEDSKTVATSDYIDWGKLTGKTILIAGANGYVPQFFIHTFLCRNDLFGSDIRVVALCRNKDKAYIRFGEYLKRSDFQILYQDICDEVKLNEKIDYIIHAASPAGIKITMDNPMSVFDANVMGMKNMADIALRNGAKVLYISSVDVYGHIPELKRYEETDIGVIDHLTSRNIYASAKRATESLCMCYGKLGLDYVIARPSQIMGPGIGLDDERLHINMINQMLTDGKIILKGDGTPKRSFIYVTDVITGMLCAMTKGEAKEVYNVCNEAAEATVRELAETISELISGSAEAIEYDYAARTKDLAVKSVVSQVCISSGKLRKIGWEPKLGLLDAGKRMIEYYQNKE
ncbi:NAD-dependent epimerase/dehydratase family protein [Konateibacter massiliensis]|uniref:NAD-dependent epimerase/dehydratase family protein n=1 Tax=Konateibacter massiliensis TaxID=2002841 RepID=UPI000C15F50D|nr:NAD-dependent epimerase/dehydratase family protein [Konateibacter massiliensis]